MLLDEWRSDIKKSPKTRTNAIKKTFIVKCKTNTTKRIVSTKSCLLVEILSKCFSQKCPVLHIIFFVFRKCYRILLAVLKVYVCRLLIFTMSYSWLQFLTLSIAMYLAPIQHTCSKSYKNNYFFCKFHYILSNGEIIFRECGA